jgi:hypothetical protein
MLDLLLVAAVLAIAMAFMPITPEELWGALPWLPMALAVLVGVFLLWVSYQAFALGLVRVRRFRDRVARRRWLAGMVRLSREELFRLQTAWATIERSEAMDPSDPGYSEVQEGRRQAEEVVQTFSALAASQGKLLPESSAQCHKVIWIWEMEDPRAPKAWHATGRFMAGPPWEGRIRSRAWLVAGHYQRLGAGVLRPPLAVIGVLGLLGMALIAGKHRDLWWEGAGLALAGGCIGAVLARWRRLRSLGP